MKWRIFRGNGSPQRPAAAPASGGSPVIFPGPEEWELWNQPAGGSVRVGTADQPRRLPPAAGCVMSLPARAFFSVPLWVPVVEESPVREQTQIKLEMKGMLGGNPETAVWNFETVRKEQLPPAKEGEEAVARQLEATAVLASPFPDGWLVEAAVRYEPAGRLVPPAASGCQAVLRRELGRWVVDFYQDGKWFHTQLLLATKLEAAAAVELLTTIDQLESEGVLARVDGWWIRETGAAIPEDFLRLLPAPVRVEDRVSPRLPKEPWNLPPPALTELRAQRSRQAQRKKLIRTALTGYLAVGFVILSFFAWPVIRLKLAQAELGKIGSEANGIRDTAMLWREAGAWLEPRRNALELLWQVSRPLIENDPPKIEGVRLTLFDLNAKRLLLQGEGNDLERVEKYIQWLKNEPALLGFTWKNPQPRLLPTGNAQFQLEGVPPGVSVTEEQGGGDNENADTP